MKVPTYHKFGLTKARIKRTEIRDKKISDILTHQLTIGIGIVLGVLVYILNYSKVQPSTVIQAVMQVFLFASMGIICVGIPAVLFKFAEIFYFKYINKTSHERRTIQRYQEEREEFDFWKLRRDYSFWRVLDGFSYETEIINILLHIGYKMIDEEYSDDRPYDRVLGREGKRYYVIFNTQKEISETDTIEKMIRLKDEKSCDVLMVYSQKGFAKRITGLAIENEVELYDINGLIRIVKTIKQA